MPSQIHTVFYYENILDRTKCTRRGFSIFSFFYKYMKIDSKFEVEITGHKVYPVAISRRPDISSFASAGRRLCVVFGAYW